MNIVKTPAQAQVIRQADSRVFLDGPELCREYLRNAAMWFGSSTLQPGQTGGVDPGHPGAWEVFFCANGHAVVDDGSCCHELMRGDALLIPPGVPHTITNVGPDEVLIVWAGAPGSVQPPASHGETASYIDHLADEADSHA